MTMMDRIRLAAQILFCHQQLVGAGETTSPKIAAIAARGLKQPEKLTASEVRSVCASALTQTISR